MKSESLKVLVAEDEPGLAELIRILLQRSGLVGPRGDRGVSTVGTLAAALAKIETFSPDVVLLDTSLPDAPGLAGISAMHAVVHGAPILVLTDCEDDAFAVDALNAGAQDYLVKGEFDHRSLARAIRYAIARVRIEARLSLLDAALQATENSVVITDVDARIEWANPAFTRLTGYSVGEAVGLTPGELLRSGCNSRELYEGLWQTVLSGATWRGELINRRKDGSLFDEELTITPLLDARGQVSHFVAIMQDVSERKRAARALAESEQRLELALAGAALGMWDWHIPSGRVTHNQRWLGVLGYGDGEIASEMGTWLRLIHADDQAQVNAAMRGHLRGLTPAYECEYRVRHKDQHWVWILDRGKVVEWDGDGKPLRALGTHLDISQRKEAEDKIRNLAYYDSLTGLPNRRLLMDRLQQALAAGERGERHGGLLFIDLDHFKQLNDTRGHDVGDLLLIEVAERLRGCVRAGDTAARLGGDEFVLMLPDIGAEAKEAVYRLGVVCDKVLNVLNRPFLLAGESASSGASVGAAVFQAQGQAPAEILKNADLAMYEAKADGRGRWHLAAK